MPAEKDDEIAGRSTSHKKGGEMGNSVGPFILKQEKGQLD